MRPSIQFRAAHRHRKSFTVLYTRDIASPGSIVSTSFSALTALGSV